MYFMLGNIAFEPVNLTDFNETHSADFAEHAVLKGKPKLQAMGEKLTDLSFAIRLHHKIGGVESRYQSLLSAKAKQDALALMWGSKYKGNFVITDISSTTLFTDGKGNALAREMNISLREFVGNGQNSLLGAALNVGGKSLLGSILPASVIQGLSKIKETVQKGITMYNNAMNVVNEVRNTVAVVRQLASDPLGALSALPGAIGGLDQALGGFAGATGLGEAFSTIRTGLSAIGDIASEAALFSRDVGEMISDVHSIKETLLGVDEYSDWGNWVSNVDAHFDHFDEIAIRTETAAAKMTAWIVLREDENVEILNDPNRT